MQKDHNLILSVAVVLGKKIAHIILHEGNVYTIWCRKTNNSFSKSGLSKLRPYARPFFEKKSTERKQNVNAKVQRAKSVNKDLIV